MAINSSLIYLLNMVMFNSFLFVDQMVTPTFFFSPVNQRVNGEFLKEGYPQSSSISRWDFPRPSLVKSLNFAVPGAQVPGGAGGRRRVGRPGHGEGAGAFGARPGLAGWGAEETLF